MKKLLWKITIGVTVMLIMNFAMIGIANAASTGANYYGITVIHHNIENKNSTLTTERTIKTS